ncbi:hypothetical protein J437_LFUL015784 [Ladona fulva]|uniref:Disease resistance R13L4/SHOC-2-like LRR domain-containing protein n=1 Tax=Ladona fulva TaxID=123851 RepID=A0A8K0KMJ8_LADFU|nr:hypothetical protein J437_LFUL015784 [Ladona fulva]
MVKYWAFQGTIRNLSPHLWRLSHLTVLYLNNNCLSRIPPDIGKLSNLQHLDLSNNKLRSLPSELGDLICLRVLSGSVPGKLKSVKKLRDGSVRNKSKNF